MMFLTLKVHRKGGKDKINEVSELKYTENQYKIMRKYTASRVYTEIVNGNILIKFQISYFTF